MNLNNRENLLLKFAGFLGIASLSSFLSFPGIAKANSQTHFFQQTSDRSLELAQSTPSNSNSPSGGSNTPSNTNTPGGSSNTPSNRNNSGGSNTPSNTNTPGGSSNTPNQRNSQSSLSTRDRNFINQAAQLGMLEVQLGQLAVQQGSSNAVKQYGQRMVQEHTQANQQLMQLARQKGVTPASQLDNQHQAVRSRLSKLSGSSFDEAYMREMINSHNQAIALFQAQAQQGNDSDLKAWAGRTIPNLQAHLQMANQTAQNTQQNRR
ncbi:MAG: DUF4142 domain-containing protein [Actinomycetota bacterium]